MKHSNKILWGEGLFLRPQHFQRQDAYHESRLAEFGRTLHPYAWGIRHLKLDIDALNVGILRILELSAILPDGEIYNSHNGDDLPEALSLEVISQGTASVTFYLALPPLRELGNNYSKERESSTLVRYYKAEDRAPDLFTSAIESQVTVLKKAVRLVSDSESREQMITIPFCCIRRTATGGYELDPTFMPPATSIRAIPALYLQLRRLLDILQAKVNALYGFHREPAKHVIEFRSGDVASFWLLHTVSSAFASLSHLFHHSQLHPERLYQQMLELAGALLTFSKSYTFADLPVYSHSDPGPAFAELDKIIRDLLETVISTRYFSIALTKPKPSYHVGRLDSERINNATDLYLGVEAEIPAVDLVKAIPERFKIGAPDDVEEFVVSAMPGVRLHHSPQVPSAIPVRPGAYYFKIESRGPLYEQILKAQSMAIYTPSGIPGLKLELLALTQS